MDGMGSSSRLGGRSSSRYGSAPAVFTGPVRKWKKEWVHVAPRPPNPKAHKKDTCRLVLCKWTRSTAASSQPPRRRFRYAPVVDVRLPKTESKDKKINDEVPGASVGEATMADDVYEKLEMFDALAKDTQPTLSSIFGDDDDDVKDLDLGGMSDAVKQSKMPSVEAAATSGRTWLTD